LNDRLPTVEAVRELAPGMLRESADRLDLLRKQARLHDCTRYGQARLACRQLQTEVAELLQLHAQLADRCQRQLDNSRPLLVDGGLAERAAELDLAEARLEAMKLREQLECQASAVQAALVTGSFDRAAEQFRRLALMRRDLRPPDRLPEAEAAELRADAEASLEHWAGQLRRKFSAEFAAAVRAIGWPFNSGGSTGGGSADTSTPVSASGSASSGTSGSSGGKERDFVVSFRRFAQLQVPAEASGRSLPPLEVMLEPFRKKFAFHFSGDRPTNDPARPEIFLTQVLKWIKEHDAFLGQVVQPCLDQVGMSAWDVREEFASGLMELVKRKLGQLLEQYRELPDKEEADLRLAHLINELLALDRELAAVGLPSAAATVGSVLGEPRWLAWWEGLEAKFAQARLDEILLAGDAWSPAGGVEDSSSSSSAAVPQCAEAVMALVQALGGRANLLRTDLHKRARLFRVQLDVLEDFRVRLRQVTRRYPTSDPRWFGALNSLQFARDSLTDWADQLDYAELSRLPESERSIHGAVAAASGTAGDEAARAPATAAAGLADLSSAAIADDDDSSGAGVFAPVARRLAATQSELLESLVRGILDQLAALLESLGPDTFLSGRPSDAPALAALFLAVRDSLQACRDRLQPAVFRPVWRRLAAGLNRLLMRQLLGMRFSHAGGLQFAHTVTKVFMPVFAQYCGRPDRLLAESAQACCLLGLARGTAALLRQALAGPPRDGEDPLRMLLDLGVSSLTPEEALAVLKRRIDLDQA
uniref:DHC_N2 domain-containing protein n=1 Tax=Macrostomum lignano TaxID=282301 RepID=A0A1I8JGG3_9PLAT